MRWFQTGWIVPAFLLIPLGCRGELVASPSEAPTPPSAVAAVPTAPATAPATAFACCADEAALSVVGPYLGAQAALAKDDNAAAGAALTTLQAQVEAAKAQPGLDQTSAGALAAIGTETSGALAAPDIESRRTAFKKLSAAVLPFARAHAGGARTITEAFCPMASASWLQEGMTLANPYFGASMLTCGSFK